MSRLRRAPIAVMLVTLLWVGSNAAAQEVLFGVDGAGGGGPSSLYELSPVTGLVIAGPIGGLGAIGFSHVVAIDFDPTTGALFGVSNAVPPFLGGPATLITINPLTGVGAAVAVITGMTPCFDDNVPDMSFDSTGVLWIWRPCSTEIFTLSKTTGVATLVSVAPHGLFLFGSGLAFDSTDTLYLKDFFGLRTVSTVTGALSAPVTCCSGSGQPARFRPN